MADETTIPLRRARLNHLIARAAYWQGHGTVNAYLDALQALRRAVMRAEVAIYFRPRRSL